MQIIGRVSLLIGTVLLLITIAGLFLPLRSPWIDLPDHVAPAEEILSAVDRRAGESDRDYGTRLTHLLHHALTGYYFKEDQPAWKLHGYPPIWENWILFSFAQMEPLISNAYGNVDSDMGGVFYVYDYGDPVKAVERGVGYCGQYARIFAGFGLQNGLEVGIVSLDGHILHTWKTKEGWFTGDSYFDVILPHPADALKEDPNLLATATERFQRTVGPLMPSAQTTYGDARALNPTLWKAERASYWLIWIVPVILIAAGGLLLRKSR